MSRKGVNIMFYLDREVKTVFTFEGQAGGYDIKLDFRTNIVNISTEQPCGRTYLYNLLKDIKEVVCINEDVVDNKEEFEEVKQLLKESDNKVVVIDNPELIYGLNKDFDDLVWELRKKHYVLLLGFYSCSCAAMENYADLIFEDNKVYNKFQFEDEMFRYLGKRE